MARTYVLHSPGSSRTQSVGFDGVSRLQHGTESRRGDTGRTEGAGLCERSGNGGSGRRTPPGPGRVLAGLSMCHISTPPISVGSLPRAEDPICRVWRDGTRVDIPANPRRLDPRPRKPVKDGQGKEAKRGKIEGFSYRSRSRFARLLCTIREDARPITMALTLPGEFRHLDAKFLQDCFVRLSRRFSAMVMRRARKRSDWARLAAAWKKEVQKRGALHWHLLFYGIEDPELGAELHQWIARQWVALVGRRLEDPERAKMLSVHLHPTNWQQVRSVGYFAKYVGKVQDAPESEGSTGRWWGFWNRAAMPWADLSSGVVSDRVAVDLNRIARKLRKHRMKQARFRAQVAYCFDPEVHDVSKLSEWYFQRLRQGYGDKGRDPARAQRTFRHYRERTTLQGCRLGASLGRAPIPGSGVILTGSGVVSWFDRALAWSAEKNGEAVPLMKSRDEQKRESHERLLRKWPQLRRQATFEGDGAGGFGGVVCGDGSRVRAIRRGKIGPAFAGNTG